MAAGIPDAVKSNIDTDRFPEWQPFLDAVQQRRPDAGSWCEAWTVRDIVIHQAGNALELARVLGGHLAGEPVATRTFEEREAPLRAMNGTDLWAALHQMSLRAAALDLVRTFNLEPAPSNRTEKRHG